MGKALIFLVFILATFQSLSAGVAEKPNPDRSDRPADVRFLGKESSPEFRRERLPAGAWAESGVGGSGTQLATDFFASSQSIQTPLIAVRLRDFLAVGGIPTSVTTGDFNRDGRADLIVSCGWDNTLWVHLGRGDGTFEPATIIQVGDSPLWIRALDLSRRGILDLVVLEADSRSISILRGRGDGTFDAPERYFMPLLALPTCFTEGDFNGDGNIDLVVGVLPRFERVYFVLLPGDGHGRFLPFVREEVPPTVPLKGPYFVSGAIQISSGDLNGDGARDLVVNDPDPRYGGVMVYLNRGDGRFTQGQWLFYNVAFLDLRALSTLVSDLDEDGRADVLVSDNWGGRYAYIGKGDGSFHPDSTAEKIGTLGTTIEMADVTGDGKPDLIGAGWTVAVLPRLSGYTFEPAYVYLGERSIVDVQFADFNGDGALDFVTANQGNDTATVFINQGNGRFGAPDGREIGPRKHYGRTGLVFGDLDHNGFLDVVCVTSAPAEEPRVVAASLNDGAGNFSASVHTDLMYQPMMGDMVLADFRNSGQLDFLAVGTYAWPYVCFAPGLGDGRFGQRTFTQLSNPRATGRLTTGDFNKDGKLDFVVAGAEGVTFFQGNGNGTFTDAAVLSFGPAAVNPPLFAWSGDYNRDGNPDVLVRLFEGVVPHQGNDLYEFLGDGHGHFAAGRVVISNVEPMEVADVDKDGLPDVLVVADRMTDYPANTPARLAVYKGQPDGTFHKTHEYGPLIGYATFGYDEYISGHEPGLAPLIGDFNGDDNTDVAVYQVTGGVEFYQILAGNGDGTFTVSQWTLSNQRGGLPNYTADLTGDGKDDLVSFDSVYSSFYVLESEQAPLFSLDLWSPLVGSAGAGRVRLDHPAESPVTFELSSNRAGVDLPSTVTIPAGQLFQYFPVALDPSYDWRKSYAVTARAAGETRTTTGFQWPKRVFYFPQIADGVSGDVGFWTSIVLVNTGNDGSADLEFLDVSGQPMEVTLAGHGAASTLRLPLGRGQSVSVKTSGRGNLQVGYVRIVADEGIGGTAIYTRSDKDGQLVFYEAGVAAATPMTSATMLVDLRMPRSTAFAMVNCAGSGSRDAAEPRDNRVQIRLYDQDAQLMAEKELTLAPGQHLARFIHELFGATPGLMNLQGTVTIAASSPLALVTLLQTDDPTQDFPTDVPNLTTYPVARRSADLVLPYENPPRPYGLLAGRDVIVPQIANGISGTIGIRTELSFVNPGPDTWTRVEFYDSSGQPMELELPGFGMKSILEFFMKSGGTRTFETSGSGPLQVGSAWLRIGDRVEALAIFTRFDAPTGRVYYRAGVPAVAPRQEFSVAVDSIGNRETGIAVANKIVSSLAVANLQLNLYDRSFQLLASRQISVPPQGQLARFVWELFPDVPGVREMEGVLSVVSDFPVAPLTLQQQESPGVPFPAFVPILTTFPVLPGAAH